MSSRVSTFWYVSMYIVYREHWMTLVKKLFILCTPSTAHWPFNCSSKICNWSLLLLRISERLLHMIYILPLKSILVMKLPMTIAGKVLGKEKSNSKWNEFIQMKNTILQRWHCKPQGQKFCKYTCSSYK